MKLSQYMRDKLLFIILQGIICVTLLVIFHLFHINMYMAILTVLTVILVDIGGLLLDFFARSSFYNHLNETLEQMEEKQLIAGFLEKPSFLEGEIICDIIRETTKAMNDQIAAYQVSQEEYQEYIETWIHEIKTPLACVDLICKNDRNELTRRIEEEIQKIDQYVEQALYYARSTNVAGDYCIKKCLLSDIVKNTVKKYSKQLIACHTRLKLDLESFFVYADEKWLEFIIGQIIANSLKYRREDLELSFLAVQNTDSIILRIKDNGSGIAKNDLPRVFEKGFTGQNGRKFAKSTGIGLYLCKMLCQKMYLDIRVESRVGVGTTIEIIFPRDSQCFILE